MSEYLRIGVTFLDSQFHGRGDGGEPEWPPSPLRLLQAIVAANAGEIATNAELGRAVAWLESQTPPQIVAPCGEAGRPYCLSVPNNAMDIVGRAWVRGNYFGSGDANPATHRTMKTLRPVRMCGGDTVNYLWKLDDSAPISPLIAAAGRIVALGWGIDLVVGCGERISSTSLCAIPGERWLPTTSTNVAALRIPAPGTLTELQKRHDSFLHRIGKSGFTPVKPLTHFSVSGYRRATDPVARPHALFELRRNDGSFCRYPQKKLVHIAGMVRHVSKEVMTQSPPPEVDGGWVERYVTGHRDGGTDNHQQFSYLPLPTIGHTHSDQAVRRVMVVSPMGSEVWLEHLAQRLRGRMLAPEHGNEFDELGPPALVRVYHDKVARRYVERANRWASVTPVILPGHDDRKPKKTRKLIEAALAQSGIDLPCEFEWSAHSVFRKSFSAHKYDKDRKPVGYIRPDHLLTQTAVHLRVRFRDRLCLTGPLVIGAGRHCGFGLMAGTPE